MIDQRLLAYVLIAVGIVGLLSRLTPDAGWLWVALVAATFLTLYVRQKAYPFLVIGAIFAGVALGILLEGNWHWHGAFLVSLGAGIFAIDLVEHRRNRMPRWLGTVLMALGILTGLAEAGFFGTAGFGVAVIVAGAYLVWRSRTRAQPARADRVESGTARTSTAGPGSSGSDHPGGPVPQGVRTATDDPRTSRADDPDTIAPHVVQGAASTDQAGTDWTDDPDTVAPHVVPGAAASDRDAMDRDGPDRAGSSTTAGARDSTDLLATLRTWRHAAATAAGRSEGFVLSDATLDQLAHDRPTTPEALRRVRGIGEVKLERYGDALLELIRKN